MLQLFSFPFSAMASACAVHLYGDDRVGVEAVAEAAITEVARIEQRYSRYRSDSALAEINDVAARAGSIVVDDETAKLIDSAYACHQRSDGLFDITSGILRRVWDSNAANCLTARQSKICCRGLVLPKSPGNGRGSPFPSSAWSLISEGLGRSTLPTKRLRFAAR